MKKSTIAIILILSTILTACCFSGCGKKSDEIVYETKELSLDTQYRTLGGIVERDDSIYLLAFEMSQSGSDNIVVSKLNKNGKKLDSFYYESKQFTSIEENWEGQNIVANIAVDQASNIWLLEEHYSVQVLTADDTGESDYRLEYALTKVDAKGKVLLSIDINELFGGKDGHIVRKQILCDNEGNVYLLLREGMYGSLWVYNSEGQLLYEPKEEITTIAVTETGTVMAVVRDDKSDTLSSLCTVDTAMKSMGEKRDVNVSYSYIYGGTGDDLLINDRSRLYAYDTKTGELRELFAWVDIDIMSSDIEHMGMLSDGRYVLLGSSFYSVDSSIIMLEAVPASSVEEKTLLTLATGSASYELKAAAVQFNKTNTYYKIKLVEYADPNGIDASSLDQFYIDIVSGNIPDMVDLDYFSPEQLIGAGIMEDLYSYLDNDTDLSREAFLPNLIDAIDTNGCLYYLPKSFYLQVVAGDADVVGDTAGWNMQEMYDAIENNPDYEYIFGSLCSQAEFINLAMDFNLTTYVDFENYSCSFDKPEFYELLEFTKDSFPTEGGELLFRFEYRQLAPVMEGEQMLYSGLVRDVSYFMLINELFDGNASFVGFPADGDNGNVFMPVLSLGITKASAHKDIAWDFLRGFYLEESSDNSLSTAFPSNINALRAVLGKSTEKVFFTNGDGEKIEDTKFSFSFSDRYGQSIRIELFALTQSELDYVWEIIYSVNKISIGDRKIEAIVTEEASAFFAGANTAEETAALINSRVNILLNERK